jgi:hypothetical protein
VITTFAVAVASYVITSRRETVGAAWPVEVTLASMELSPMLAASEHQGGTTNSGISERRNGGTTERRNHGSQNAQNARCRGRKRRRG